MSSVTRFFLLSFIAIGLVACNNEEVPQIETGAKATVTVKIFNDQTKSSRAVDGNVKDEQGTVYEREIKTLQIWLFADNGLVVTDEYFEKPEAGTNFDSTTGGYMVNEIETTSGTRTMIVVANHPKITGVSTKTDLLNKEANGVLSQSLTNGMVMTSEEVSFVLKPGENLYGDPKGTYHENGIAGIDYTQVSDGEKNLQLTRINARIALIGLTFKSEPTETRFDGFELTEVALFNARATSKLFGTSLVNGNTFQFGAWYPTTESSYIGYNGVANQTPENVSNGFTSAIPNNPTLGTITSDLRDTRTVTNFTTITSKNAYYYYVYENDGDTDRKNKNGTFIVLKGRLLKGTDSISIPGVLTDANGFTYYTIWINDPQYSHANSKNEIKRNTGYNLTVNISGAGHPTVDPKVNSFLDVQIEVADWEFVDETINWEI